MVAPNVLTPEGNPGRKISTFRGSSRGRFYGKGIRFAVHRREPRPPAQPAHGKRDIFELGDQAFQSVLKRSGLALRRRPPKILDLGPQRRKLLITDRHREQLPRTELPSAGCLQQAVFTTEPPTVPGVVNQSDGAAEFDSGQADQFRAYPLPLTHARDRGAMQAGDPTGPSLVEVIAGHRRNIGRDPTGRRVRVHDLRFLRTRPDVVPGQRTRASAVGFGVVDGGLGDLTEYTDSAHYDQSSRPPGRRVRADRIRRRH